MTELELKALKLRRARLHRQPSFRNSESIQEKAQKFSSEWRRSIVVKPVSA
jgi:hypothetical protein